MARKTILALTCLGLTGAAPALADAMQIPGPRHVAPETLLVPISAPQTEGAPIGWSLLYRNTLSGSDTSSTSVETRPTASGQITWRIFRTRNDACATATAPRCPDRIEVISVPEGFMAVPGGAWVEEGDALRILIVPALVG